MSETYGIAKLFSSVITGVAGATVALAAEAPEAVSASETASSSAAAACVWTK